MKKIRVIRIVPSLAPGGAERMAVHAYLRDSSQLKDLAFILDNTDGLTAAFTMHGNEVIMHERGV